MRSPHTLFALPLFAALFLHGCGCFVPVTEKQCDNQTPCGSGWVCLGGVCHPPDGGRGGGGTGGGAVGGGGGGGAGGGVGGGAGGGVGGGSTGGGTGGGGTGGGGATCTGCRDPLVNQCLPGNTQTRCGKGGQLCQICQTNQTCQNGSCINIQCNSASCPSGCCRNGSCVPTSMQSAQACGLGGQTCTLCPFGQDCQFGKCTPVTGCSSANCSGCCKGTTCITLGAQSPTNCGKSGNVCVACPVGQLCSNGACTPTTACSGTTCPNGCCSGGTCVPWSAQSTSMCGNFGGQCFPCPGGGSCNFGACTTPICSPANCGGCCTATGCTSGTSASACGKNGAFCFSCNPGQVCQTGFCTTTTKKIGDACTASSECAAIGTSAYCKFQTSSGNGVYLNGFCTRPCNSDGGILCTPDSVCLSSLQPYGESDAFCSPRCNNMSQCRSPGYACYYINTISTTACWLNPIPGAGVDAGVQDAGMSNFIGAACVNAGQCTNPSNAFCIQDVIPGLGASGFVGGYCSTLCSGVPCPALSSCQSVTGFSSGITQQVCLRDCSGPRTGQANCRNGYVCEGTFGATVGACLPRCNNAGATCPAGTGCNVMSGYCN